MKQRESDERDSLKVKELLLEQIALKYANIDLNEDEK